MRFRLLLTAASLLSVNFAAHADTVIGDMIHTKLLFPNTSTTLADFGTATATNGLTYTDPQGYSKITFSSNKITITNLTAGSFNVNSFNGYDIAFLSGAAISSVTYDATSSLLFSTGSVLSFTSNDIKLNFAGTCAACNGGESIVLDVTDVPASVTPEPSSLLLLGTGMLGVVGAWKRRIA